MKLPNIIGADISKKSIDFACHLSGTHFEIENNSSGFRGLIKWIQEKKIDMANVMIVMEHTGLYSYQLEQFLHHNHIRYTKIPALEIKLSMGMVRGKSDKQDAYRIARYGFEKVASLVAVKPADPDLQRLEMLYSTRERLVRNRAGLVSAVKMYQETCCLPQTDVVIKSQLQLIKNFDRQIEKLNEEMQNIIESQKAFSDNYRLLQSVKGVGPVLALATIIRTKNFTSFTTARKLACCCGTAPFEKTSGTSVKGKTRVSKLADKRMKTLLDLAAKSAIQHDKELREYYLRRTQNGKSKMSTINVVRNKILYRMFAVIKRQTPFVENYLQAA